MRQATVDIYDCKSDSERPADDELIYVKRSLFWHPAFYSAKKDSVLCTKINPFGDVQFNKLSEWYRPIAVGK